MTLEIQVLRWVLMIAPSYQPIYFSSGPSDGGQIVASQLALAGYNTKGQAHVDHNGYLVWRKWHFSVTLKVALIDSPIGVKHQLEEYFSYIVAVYIIKEYVHCNHNGRLFCSLSMKHYLLAAIKSRCHSLFIG
jgi:hypothetical protein